MLIDPDYVKDRKVFGHVLAAFRYGREDLDVLGLTFRKDLYLAAEQIYPQDNATTNKKPLTRLQVTLTPPHSTQCYDVQLQPRIFFSAGTFNKKIGTKCVSILFRITATLSGERHLAAGTGRHRQAVWC